MSVALNTKHLSSFISEEEYAAIYPQVEAAHKQLEAKNGPGSDFLGWMTLPRDYDKEEFTRLLGKLNQSYDGFVKRYGKYDKMGARMLGHKYPEIKRVIMERPDHYNAMVKECEALAKEGKVLILRPNHLLNSFESDVRKLEMAYWHGYRMTKEKMKKIKRFIEE